MNKNFGVQEFFVIQLLNQVAVVIKAKAVIRMYGFVFQSNEK